MKTSTPAREAFCFYTRMHLTELTGMRAASLAELLKLVEESPGACIYHHTHRFLQQHQFLSPEPPNDFAYWVEDALGEDALAEKLASIDTVQFSSIRSLRDKIAQALRGYLSAHPAAGHKVAPEGEEFHLMTSVSVIIPTHYVARDGGEFVDCLKRVTIHSLYFHVFEARLRLERGRNDFSWWIETSLGNKKAADKIARLDPYTDTLEGLRAKIITIMEKDGGYGQHN